jgi:hypothetical protein
VAIGDAAHDKPRVADSEKHTQVLEPFDANLDVADEISFISGTTNPVQVGNNKPDRPLPGSRIECPERIPTFGSAVSGVVSPV